MEEKGTMCITELWPERMKQELIKTHLKHETVISAKDLYMTDADKNYTSVYRPN